jgi:hypothetical protein
VSEKGKNYIHIRDKSSKKEKKKKKKRSNPLSLPPLHPTATDLLRRVRAHAAQDVAKLPNIDGAGVVLVILEKGLLAPLYLLSTQPECHGREIFRFFFFGISRRKKKPRNFCQALIPELTKYTQQDHDPRGVEWKKIIYQVNNRSLTN